MEVGTAFGQSRQGSNGINNICSGTGKLFFMPEFPCRFSSPKANFVQELMKEMRFQFDFKVNSYISCHHSYKHKLPRPFADLYNVAGQLSSLLN